jgi:uncharacterized protein involved in exopolysaccharide biosynthesis
MAEPQTPPRNAFVQYWGAIRRRSLPMLLTLIGVFLAAVVAAVLWPPLYRSSGTILIEQQEVPTDLVRSTVSSYADERIQVITQRVMTTENLMGIIERYDLYHDMRRVRPREEVIAAMRSDINTEMISAKVIDPREGRPTEATIAFSVSYASNSAAAAARVANELVSLYLKQNIETRQQSSRDAAAFFEQESERLTKAANELEAKLAAFKQAHVKDLPEQTQLNSTTLTRLDEEQRDIETQIQSLGQQITYLDAQLAQISPTDQVYSSTGERVQSPADRLKYLRSEYARLSALYSPDHPDVLRAKREIEGLEATVGAAGAEQDLTRQLTDARTQLASLKQRYADDHPDVIRAQRLVDSLQQQMASGSTAAEAQDASHPDNPAYIQIKAQREVVTDQIKALQKKRGEIESQIQDYERRVASAPAVQRDFDAIARELESTQQQYTQLRLRQNEAQLADNLETARKGERFTLIEPPLEPEQPASPNRGLIVMLGVVLGLLGSLGLGALLESVDTSVRGRADLQRVVEVPPLAIIPRIITLADIALRRRRQKQVWIGAAASVLVTALAVQFFYRPLDVVFTLLLRRLGVGI